jgi:hypothetical protein
MGLPSLLSSVASVIALGAIALVGDIILRPVVRADEMPTLQPPMVEAYRLQRFSERLPVDGA